MSANGYLIDALTRHQSFIQRYAGGEFKKVLPILKRMARDIRAALTRQDLTSYQAARLNVLLAEIGTITQQAGNQMAAVILPDMAEFAQYESQFVQKAMQGAVTVALVGVQPAVAAAAVNNSTMKLISGNKTTFTTMDRVFDTFAAGAAKEVMTAVQAGIIAGDTTQQIVSQVMGMVNSRTRQQAETVVRTVTNHAGSMGRAAFYRENASVIAKEEYTATLDGRTTITCASLDGNVYPIGDGPHPPIHYNCRSLRIALVEPEFQALKEGATRASIDGPVSSQSTYGGWLAKQSKEFQDEVLGKERADLFRSGAVSIGRFTDDNGVVYTLDQLKQREGLALE